MAKEFSRIGARDLHVAETNNQHLPEQSNVFCPHCGGGPMDGVTGCRMSTGGPSEDTRPLTPTAGSPSCCMYCGEFSIYAQGTHSGLTLVLPTTADLKALKHNPDVWRTLLSVQESVREKATKMRLRGELRYARKVPKRY